MCGQNFDLVIRNGTVIDGTGAAGRADDVGVTGDRITAELNPKMFAALCSSI